jgi:hypothetical protein
MPAAIDLRDMCEIVEKSSFWRAAKTNRPAACAPQNCSEHAQKISYAAW